MKLDRPNIKLLRPEIDAALADLGKRLGLQFKAGHASYEHHGQSATFKLEINAIDENGQAYNPDAETFRRHAPSYGLNPEDLGRTFISGGTEYRITGLNTGAPKFPILAERTKDGRGFKFPEASVKHALTPLSRPEVKTSPLLD